MTSRREFLKTTAAIGVSVLAPQGVIAQGKAKYTGKLAHPESPTQPRHKGLEKFVSLVRDRTNGEVEFTIYPSGQLGTQRQLVEGVQFGAIECAVLPSSNMTGFNPVISILDMPYLYPTDRAISAQLRNGAFGKALLKSFTARGFHAAAMWPNGRKCMTSNKSLADIESYRGQKFRVIDSRVLIEQFAALGASAIPINFGELYTALQTGVVDGQENPLDTITTMKFNEVQKYLVVTEHGVLEDVAIFHPAWWNKLPADHQETITKTLEEVAPDVEKLKEAAQQAALSIIKSGSINVRVADEAERSRMRSTMSARTRAAFLAIAGDNGKKILELYDTEAKRLGV
jgi:tripartite ATP-independent transporter DctP family solute receptor